MKPAEPWLPDAQQALFRRVLDAFARPGTPVATDANALEAFLGVVLDESVSLADPQRLLAGDLRRRLMSTDAPVTQARLVVADATAACPSDFKPALGTLESPESGATLVLRVAALREIGDPDAAATELLLSLQGPGVPGTRDLIVAGLDGSWLEQRARWCANFPLGVDLVLAAPDALAMLPRTTRISTEKR